MINPRLLILLLLTLFAPGCDGGKRVSPGAISHERFTEYYAGELFLIERSRLTGTDSLGLGRQLDSLRAAFSLSRGARDTLLSYYRDSLPRWEEFLGDVLRRLESRAGVRRGRPAGAGAASPGRR